MAGRLEEASGGKPRGTVVTTQRSKGRREKVVNR